MTDRKHSHAAGVMKRLQSPKVPPGWRKTVLQEVTTALAGRLEELDVAPQPRLDRQTDRKQGGRQVSRGGDRWTVRKRERQNERETETG